MIANAVSAVHFRCGSKGEILAASRCFPLFSQYRTFCMSARQRMSKAVPLHPDNTRIRPWSPQSA
jgi:hypothetical protein